MLSIQYKFKASLRFDTAFYLPIPEPETMTFEDLRNCSGKIIYIANYTGIRTYAENSFVLGILVFMPLRLRLS